MFVLKYAFLGRLTAGLALKYALHLTAGLVCLLWLGALAARAADHYVSLAGTNDSAGQYTNWAGAATQIQWTGQASPRYSRPLTKRWTSAAKRFISMASKQTMPTAG